MDDGIAELHLAVCRRFGETVESADGKWERRTPCDAWDARGVLEHVIGFHDVLVLRPMGLKPDRPGEPQARWQLTYEALVAAFASGRVTQLDAYRLVPNLSRDILVHTWDLARAVGADDRLDPAWCELFYAGLPTDPGTLIGSGMFSSPVELHVETDVQARLLARLGRNPFWSADL